MNRSFANVLIATICLVLPVALQIQVTLFQSADYLGLRINLGDLLLPFAGLGILYTLIRRQSFWPQWQLRHLYIWLAGLAIVLGGALLHTHFTYGEISRWALVNKFAGWFILAGLLGLGGWIGTNAKQTHVALFAKSFLYFGLAIVVIESLLMLGESYFFDFYASHNIPRPFPLAGLMVNRNAFGVLYLALTTFSLAFYFSDTQLLKRWYYLSFFAFMPYLAMFNASRTMIVTLVLVLLGFFLFNLRQAKKIGTILLCFAFCAGLIVLVYHDKPKNIMILKGKQLDFEDHFGTESTAEKPNNKAHVGDSMRLTILEDAKHMIAEYPVTGSGLGSMLLYQEKTHGKAVNIIDCTPLWLLVETGVIGLLAFAAFYVQSARTMYAGWKQDEGFNRALHLGIIAAMIGFTLMSLFHEILYTRFVWVLLGLGLTLRTRHPE
jgi:hypothetical protein